MSKFSVWDLSVLLISITRTTAFAVNGEIDDPAPDFTKHSIVRPVIHHGRTKRQIITTKDISGAHHPEVLVTVAVDGKPWVLQLQLNEDLVAQDYTMMYQKGRNTVKHIPEKEELDLCHYSGNVQGNNESWVAVSTCHGLQGVIFDGQKMRYIEPALGADITSLHYIYDHKDLIKESMSGFMSNTFGNPILANNSPKQDNEKIGTRKTNPGTKQAQLQTSYQRTRTTLRFVELVLVADYRIYQHFGRNIKAVQSYLIKLANIVDTVYYAPLSIRIALVGVVVWSKRDEIAIYQDSKQTLDNFINYRNQKLISKISHDNAHLITGVRFSNGVLGRAYLDAMCSSNSGGVENMYTNVIGLMANTLAHEMGHNLGMKHDEEYYLGCRCVGAKCVMAAEANIYAKPVVNWSSCSSRALESFFHENRGYCLRKKMCFRIKKKNF